MSENMESVYLVVRENQRAARSQARRNVMQAAMTGTGLNMADIAKARGLVLRERENSIFSDAWVPLAILFILIGFFAGRNVPLLALGSVLLLVVGISTLWKNAALLGVTYEREFDRHRVFPGEAIRMKLSVANYKRLPLTWLQFRDELPIAVEEEIKISQVASEITGRYTLQSSFSLAGFEQSQREVTLRFPKRGYYKLGPVTYASGDIFTLFTVEREHQYIDRLIIFPQIYPLAELGLPAKEPFGDVKVRRSLFTDPIKTQGIRDYQPGDRFRDVHWKATAVRGSLQTKVYDPSTGMTIAVFLNVSTFARHWMGFDPELLERAISVAGSVANYGVQQNWAVGLYANGSVPNSDQPIRVPPSRSPEQLAHVLEALAAVTEFATGAIDRLLLRTSPTLPWASTIILVTAIVTEEMMIALVRLKEAGRRVVLITLSPDPPPPGLGRILTYHIPASTPAFQKEHVSSTVTEAALKSIPTPEPVEIAFTEEEA
jgi:uncharacterized protein (DUF58 family)